MIKIPMIPLCFRRFAAVLIDGHQKFVKTIWLYMYKMPSKEMKLHLLLDICSCFKYVLDGCGINVEKKKMIHCYCCKNKVYHSSNDTNVKYRNGV